MSETVSPISEDQRLFDMIFQTAVEAHNDVGSAGDVQK
jgi:hypothetical protein